MNKTIIIAREDINNPLHPNMWAELCESLGVEQKYGDWPEELNLTVKSVEVQY